MENSNEVLEQVCSIRRSFDDLVSRHSDDSGALADSVKSALDTAEFPSEEQLRKEFAKGTDRASHRSSTRFSLMVRTSFPRRQRL